MLEKGQKVYMVKKRVVYEFIVALSNSSHAIIYDAEAINSPQYQKVCINNLYTTKEAAKCARFESFSKGDLVMCVEGWSSLREGVVVDVNKLFVKVLTGTKIRKISKANILKLTDV